MDFPSLKSCMLFIDIKYKKKNNKLHIPYIINGLFKLQVLYVTRKKNIPHQLIHLVASLLSHPVVPICFGN